MCKKVFKANERIDLLEEGSFHAISVETEKDWHITIRGTWYLHPVICEDEEQIAELKERYELEEYRELGEKLFKCECTIEADIQKKYYTVEEEKTWEEFIENLDGEDLVNLAWYNYSLD